MNCILCGSVFLPLPAIMNSIILLFLCMIVGVAFQCVKAFFAGISAVLHSENGFGFAIVLSARTQTRKARKGCNGAKDHRPCIGCNLPAQT